MILLYICLIGYLVGSIPCGFLLAKYCNGVDLRDCGSESTGSTNVLRTCNKKLALATLVADVSKGLIFSVILLIFCEELTVYTATFCCIIGHIFPIWLKFKGGKGAATAAGIFLSMSPVVALICGVIWAIVAKLVKISSIASLSFCASFTVIVFFQFVLGSSSLNLALFAIAVLILLTHTHLDNIKRLTDSISMP